MGSGLPRGVKKGSRPKAQGPLDGFIGFVRFISCIGLLAEPIEPMKPIKLIKHFL
jgi:hypothetical protein